MAREYRFNPEDIRKLTTYQLKCYLEPEDRLGNRPKPGSFEQARQWVALMKDRDWVLKFARGYGLKAQ